MDQRPAAAPDAAPRSVAPRQVAPLLATVVAALVLGGGLAALARLGASALLVGVAVAQGLLALCWVLGTGLPGRKGTLLLAGFAAAGADVTASVWPHGKLGALLAVLILAVPVLFVHQLSRGAARVQVVTSLGGQALLVVAEVALAAYLQLRHEFGTVIDGRVAAMSLAAIGGAVALGCLVDLVAAVPRLDPDVPRGLLGLVLAAVAGGAIGYLMLRDEVPLPADRAVLVGAVLGLLAGLLAVATSYVAHTSAASGWWARLRPGLGALVPIAALGPVAFLLCLAVRT